MRRVAIIGPGRLGGALAIALAGSEFAPDEIVFRAKDGAKRIAALLGNEPKLIAYGNLAESSAEIFLIAVPDPEIAAIAATLVGAVQPGTVVLHTSGSLSSSVLNDLTPAGCFVGSMHPLVSASDAVAGSKQMRGAYFCLEGDAEAVRIATEIAGVLGALPFTTDAAFKPLYHAAAVCASGHLVALVDTAIEMLAACGIGDQRAREILLPLITSTVANLKLQQPASALTGPFARGDAAALERHLSGFSNVISPNAIAIYLLLAERSLDLAEARGIESAVVERMRQRIFMAKRNIE